MRRIAAQLLRDHDITVSRLTALALPAPEVPLELGRGVSQRLLHCAAAEICSASAPDVGQRRGIRLAATDQRISPDHTPLNSATEELCSRSSRSQRPACGSMQKQPQQQQQQRGMRLFEVPRQPVMMSSSAWSDAHPMPVICRRHVCMCLRLCARDMSWIPAHQLCPETPPLPQATPTAPALIPSVDPSTAVQHPHSSRHVYAVVTQKRSAACSSLTCMAIMPLHMRRLRGTVSPPPLSGLSCRCTAMRPLWGGGSCDSDSLLGTCASM